MYIKKPLDLSACLLPLMLVILSLTQFNASAQDYIVTNSGDTLKGEIKLPLFEYLFYQRVVFKADEKTTYFAKDLKGYKLGMDVYETHDIGEKNPEMAFLKPIVRGYCTLYEYQYVITSYVSGGGMGMSQPIIAYYLKKETDDKVHLFNFPLLKNGKDLYFLDNGGLTFDLRQGKYRKKDVMEIVARYNRERK